MAVLKDAATGSKTAVPATSLSWSHTCTGSELVLYVAFSDSNNVGTPTVTYNGVAMTKDASAPYNGGANTLYYLINPATGANTVSITGATSGDIQGCSFSVTGGKQTGVPYTITTANGASGTHSGTATLTEFGIAFESSGNSIATPNQTAGNIQNNNGSSGVGNFACQSAANAGSTTFTWADNGDQWFMFLVNALSNSGVVPPTPITFQQTGTRVTSGTTAGSVAYPVTSLAAGDLFLLGRVLKPETATNTTPASPFSALANTTGGTATTGIDVGLTRLTTEYLISPSGAESGSLSTVQANTPNSFTAAMIRFRKPNGTFWVTPAVVTGDDSSHGASRSAAATTAMEVLPGDMLVGFFGSDTDTTTAFTAAAFTGTGLTTDTAVIALGAGGAGTGNDCGIYITYALVTAAAGSTTVTSTLTTGPSSCGAHHIIRLRAVYPVHYGREPALVRVPRIVPMMARRRR